MPFWSQVNSDPEIQATQVCWVFKWRMKNICALGVPAPPQERLTKLRHVQNRQ
jgi:hypothetical protein